MGEDAVYLYQNAVYGVILTYIRENGLKGPERRKRRGVYKPHS